MKHRRRLRHLAPVFRDHKTTWYFRVGHGKRTRLPGKFGSPEFMQAYYALLGASFQQKSGLSGTLPVIRAGRLCQHCGMIYPNPCQGSAHKTCPNFLAISVPLPRRAGKHAAAEQSKAIAKEASASESGAPDFYNTQAWRELRYRVLLLQGGQCQCCGSRADVHIDHIKPRSKRPDLALEITNLQILCGDCNKGKGAWDQTDWRGN